MANDGREEIGGYFELALPQGEPEHSNLLALNSARNCLVYLLKARKITNLWLPYYNCAVVAAAVRRFCPETRIHGYHVNEAWEPRLDESFSAEHYLYYVNYYGLQDRLIARLTSHHLIVDNAQAFYSAPTGDADVIYCPRKFFGVSDGGYLSTTVRLVGSLEEDTSWEHATYLLKRIDCSASAAYADFQLSDGSLIGRPLKGMSRLTKRLLSSIDHAAVRESRAANFTFLHSNLARRNELSAAIEAASLMSSRFTPLCYPLKVEGADGLRARAIDQGIYVPTYWPELRASPALSETERAFVTNIVCLPIDQRYTEADMRRILDCVRA